MRRLGRVQSYTQGVLVVRSPDESIPNVGDVVLDEELTTVGTVVDIFGPVDRPYVAVTPSSEDRPVRLLGEPLYVRTDDR